MLDFTKLWDKIYLLGPNPPDLSRSDLIFFWISLIFLAVGIIAKILAARAETSSPQRFLRSRFFHLFLTMGILILSWVGLRFENIPWLSTHIVVLSLFLIWFIWLIFIGKYYVKEFRNKHRLFEEQKIKQKYL